MRKLNIYDVKSQFSQVISQVSQGETLVIAKAGKPVAKLSPYNSPKSSFRFGTMKGKIKIADDFDAPLSNDILKQFEGDSDEHSS